MLAPIQKKYQKQNFNVTKVINPLAISSEQQVSLQTDQKKMVSKIILNLKIFEITNPNCIDHFLTNCYLSII